jgi:importin-7
VIDRDEALRDDFHLESTYDYGEEDEWDDDEANWNAEEEEETGETNESKDESTAYLNFLNEEVRIILHNDYGIMLIKNQGPEVQPSD